MASYEDSKGCCTIHLGVIVLVSEFDFDVITPTRVYLT